ncbi:cobalamin-binding protein, partial [Calorimonas adulescens]
MIDLNELTRAVGELDEEKVTEMLTEFVNSKPT